MCYVYKTTHSCNGKSELREKPSQKSSLRLSNLKASFPSATVALSWVTGEASACASQHSQHLAAATSWLPSPG